MYYTHSLVFRKSIETAKDGREFGDRLLIQIRRRADVFPNSLHPKTGIGAKGDRCL
jgi:hypothetical protein